MKKALFLLPLVLLIGFLSGGTALAPNNEGAPRISILLDGSLTMEGFFKTGEIHNLHRGIVEANQGGDLAGLDTVFIFDKEGSDISQPYRTDGWDLQALGRKTFIDKAYTKLTAEHQDVDIVWLATDNVQDREGNSAEDGDIRAFYDKLGDDKVKRVFVLPASLQYDGRLWTRNGGPFATYNNKRGIVVYAILLNDSYKAFFDASVKRVAASVGLPRGGVLAKPLGEDWSLTSQIIPDPSVPPQKRLFLQDGVLSSSGAFNDGQPIKGSFLVRFHSNLDNVTIADPEVDAKIVRDFRLSDFTAGEPIIKATPRVIRGQIEPGRTSKAVAISVEFPQGVQLSTPWAPSGSWRDWGPLGRAVLKKGKGDFTGKIRIHLQVQQDQFSVPSDILLRYSTNDPALFTNPSAPPELHQKVFELDKIYASLASIGKKSSKKTILTKINDIGFKVWYPAWPLLVWLALLTTIVALGVGAWLLFGRSPIYFLSRNGRNFYFEGAPVGTVIRTDNGPLVVGQKPAPQTAAVDQQSIRLPIFRSVPVLLEKKPAAYIQRIPAVGTRVTAADGYLVNQETVVSLDITGTSFIIDNKPAPSSSSGTQQKVASGSRQLTPESIYDK